MDPANSVAISFEEARAATGVQLRQVGHGVLILVDFWIVPCGTPVGYKVVADLTFVVFILDLRQGLALR